jgi:hypothetical protein
MLFLHLVFIVLELVLATSSSGSNGVAQIFDKKISILALHPEIKMGGDWSIRWEIEQP